MSKRRMRWYLSKEVRLMMDAAKDALGISSDAEIMRRALLLLWKSGEDSVIELFDESNVPDEDDGELKYFPERMSEQRKAELRENSFLLVLDFSEEAFEALRTLQIEYHKKNTAQILEIAFGKLTDNMDQLTYVKFRALYRIAWVRSLFMTKKA